MCEPKHRHPYYGPGYRPESCCHDHGFPPPPPPHWHPHHEEECCCDEGEDEDCECECDEAADPVEELKQMMDNLAEEAFIDLVYDRMKEIIRERWSERINESAELFAERFLKAREAELKATQDEAEFDEKLNEILRKK